MRKRSDGWWHYNIAKIVVPLLLVIIVPVQIVSFMVCGVEAKKAIGVGILIIAGGVYGFAVVSPDVDVNNMTYLRKMWLKRNRILGRMMITFYKPLALIMPHRGLTHVPIIGAAIICAYTIIPIMIMAIVIKIAKGDMENITYTMKTITQIALPIWVGMSISHTVHIIQDIITSWIKRHFRHKWRNR